MNVGTMYIRYTGFSNIEHVYQYDKWPW